MSAARVRRAQPQDLPAVQALAAADADASRWPPEAWNAFVITDAPESGQTEPETAGRAAVLLLALDETDEIAGWLAATAVAGVAELEFLSVTPQRRGRGLGRCLMEAGLVWAKGEGATEMLLEVRASNCVALALYRSVGFRDAGVRQSYYREPFEDAIILKRDIPCATSCAP